MSRYNLWEVMCLSDGTIRWAFRNTNPGWKLVSTGYRIPLHQWTLVSIVYDAGVITTYANDTPVYTYSGSGSISNANVLDIGAWPAAGEWFAGLIDEVRLFDRSLTTAEIKALYAGSGPVLVLPFEKQWAADGSTVADTSGWQR